MKAIVKKIPARIKNPRQMTGWYIAAEYLKQSLLKVKLYAVTKDAQKGDEIFAGDNVVPLGKVTSNNNHAIFTDKNAGIMKEGTTDYYTILGEISPDATWVKDGDVVEVSDVCWDKANKVWSNDYNPACPYRTVQCSQCKTYH